MTQHYSKSEIDALEGDSVFLYYSYRFAKHHMTTYMNLIKKANSLDEFIAMVELELLKEFNVQ